MAFLIVEALPAIILAPLVLKYLPTISRKTLPGCYRARTLAAG